MGSFGALTRPVLGRSDYSGSALFPPQEFLGLTDSEYICMATSLRFPRELLKRVDAQAKARGVSRNRLIIDALERTLANDNKWSTEFWAEMACPPDAGTQKAAQEMLEDIYSSRVSKKDPAF